MFIITISYTVFIYFFNIKAISIQLLFFNWTYIKGILRVNINSFLTTRIFKLF